MEDVEAARELIKEIEALVPSSPQKKRAHDEVLSEFEHLVTKRLAGSSRENNWGILLGNAEGFAEDTAEIFAPALRLQGLKERLLEASRQREQWLLDLLGQCPQGATPQWIILRAQRTLLGFLGEKEVDDFVARELHESTLLPEALIQARYAPFLPDDNILAQLSVPLGVRVDLGEVRELLQRKRPEVLEASRIATQLLGDPLAGRLVIVSAQRDAVMARAIDYLRNSLPRGLTPSLARCLASHGSAEDEAISRTLGATLRFVRGFQRERSTFRYLLRLLAR